VQYVVVVTNGFWFDSQAKHQWITMDFNRLCLFK